MFDSKALVDLVVDLSASTVKQLRARARKLRDKHNLKAHFKGLWGWRKIDLVRKVAEAELDLMTLSAISGEAPMLQSIRKAFAHAVATGMVDGAKAAMTVAAGVDPETESVVEAEVAEIVAEAEAKQAPALEHKPDGEKESGEELAKKEAPAQKKTTRKSNSK